MAEARAANRLAQGVSAIMPASDLVNLSGLMDDAKCFALVRQHRWPEGVCCPGCDSSSVVRDGCDDTQPHRQRNVSTTLIQPGLEFRLGIVALIERLWTVQDGRPVGVRLAG